MKPYSINKCLLGAQCLQWTMGILAYERKLFRFLWMCDQIISSVTTQSPPTVYCTNREKKSDLLFDQRKKADSLFDEKRKNPICSWINREKIKLNLRAKIIQRFLICKARISVISIGTPSSKTVTCGSSIRLSWHRARRNPSNIIFEVIVFYGKLFFLFILLSQHELLN